MTPSDPSRPHALPPERYWDEGAFARGGTADVHLAQDRLLGRYVAGKVLREGGPPELERFHREARITARLEHPNIVPVHDLGPTWFTMKRVEGETLAGVVRGQEWGPAMLSQVIGILLRVCDALSFAHERGVYHCDIKPQNVMVGQHGQVYLMDWGIAQDGDPLASPSAGTAGWMAPEQARGEPADARTDVWGVGGLLYYALTGGRPNEGPDAAARRAQARVGRVRPPAMIAPDRALPPELVRIAMRALQGDADLRYPNVLELAADLEAVRHGGWWFELRYFEADTEIIREGDEADTAYILLEGTCEVRQGGGPIAELGPGEIFGEAALLAGGPRVATVVATTPVIARVLTREALEAELARDHWMGALVRGLARRFHELSQDNRVRR